MRFFAVLIPILGLAVNVFCQILGFRFLFKSKLLKSLFLGFLTGLLTVIALSLLDKQFLLGIFIVNSLTYICLGYCYFHFINLGETARRIRLIRELYDAGKNGLTQNEILKRYNAKQIIEIRLGRLLNNHQIIHRNHKYFIGNQAMLLIAKILILMKLLLLNKDSEF